ncbi:phosphatase PAP2-related protein [Ornithinimicrobium tianjinense]|uniref:Sphingomyelin synthase-like domain-containing protein n=1 Tax=Ornithinimicrobium tianjinense TaxID=1195761 RepID=A0A917BEJ3_9MICO|nr:phosphatase PAP2-related protein [Ornithinimicrobium tianjinense]GGF39552.1 hypothetical protein GCM10011366_03940 [Ornithinimicrobium tianjinense]
MVSVPPVVVQPSLARAWGLVLALGLVALAATLAANELISTRFADAPRPEDLLFQVLPYVRPARWLTLVALVGGLGVLLVDLGRRVGLAVGLPHAAGAFALMYLLRAGIMVLTPLAPSQGEGPFIFTTQQFGMFPSGHVGAMTLLVLLAGGAPAWVRRAQWVMLATMVAVLLLARGHYSIDVVGGLLLGYAVWTAWRTWPVLAPLARQLATPPHSTGSVASSGASGVSSEGPASKS